MTLVEVQQNSSFELVGNNASENPNLQKRNEELDLRVLHLEMKLSELNTVLYHERKEKENLIVKCSELTSRTIELLNEVKILEEHKRRSIKLFV